jgi:hypothetical protein
LTKIVENIKTHIACPLTFFRKSHRLWDNVEKYGGAGGGAQMTSKYGRMSCMLDKQDYMRVSACTSRTNTRARTHTDTNSNIYCFSKTIMINGYPRCYVIRILPGLFCSVPKARMSGGSCYRKQAFAVEQHGNIYVSVGKAPRASQLSSRSVSATLVLWNSFYKNIRIWWHEYLLKFWFNVGDQDWFLQGRTCFFHSCLSNNRQLFCLYRLPYGKYIGSPSLPSTVFRPYPVKVWMGEKVCSLSPSSVLCLVFRFRTKRYFKFYERILWHLHDVNPNKIKKGWEGGK